MNMIQQARAGRGLVAVVVATTLVVVGVPGVSQARSPASDRTSCPAAGEIQASSLATRTSTRGCNLVGRTVRAARAAVQVPPPGRRVVAHALLVSGEETLDVSTAPDGAVTVRYDLPTVARPAMSAAPPACDDNAYALHGWDYGVGGNFHWYYDATDDTRSGLSSGDAETEIVRGTQNIVTGHNDCGLGGEPNIRHTYGGRAGVRTNIVDNGTRCADPDPWSVSGFGDLVSQYLAVTCTWSAWNGSRYVVQTSDMLANFHHRWWNGRGDCAGRFDLQAVTVHERGHTFGINHPGSGHDELTMTATAFPCELRLRTLGLGDFNGLISIYGYR